MLRLRSAAPAACILALATALVGMPIAPAIAADDPCGRGSCGPGPGGGDGASGGSEGGSISVTVWGSGVSAGGGTFDVPAQTRSVAPVCWYDYLASGAEYWSWWETGRFDELMPALSWYEPFDPYPGYEEHSEDAEGGWWSPRCSSANWPGEIGDFFDFSSEFFEENSAVFVPAGEVPPQSDVPPEVLAEIAFESLEIPTGDIRWNPTRTGDGATFVGMDTWVWVEGAATSLSVTAQVSTGTWARVDAGLEHLRVGAPGAATVTCPDAGTAWSSAAGDSTCVLVFERSSANQPLKAGQGVPTSTLTATASWSASWVSSLDSTPTALPTQEQTSTAEVPVAEIQAIVNP